MVLYWAVGSGVEGLRPGQHGPSGHHSDTADQTPGEPRQRVTVGHSELQRVTVSYGGLHGVILCY